MPQIRSGRVRTKRNNRREPLLLSQIQPQNISIREGEVNSIVCPDCGRWRRLMGNTSFKIREHSDNEAGPEGNKRVPCLGSNQAVRFDITVEEWSEAMLAADSTAIGRRSARQHYKPLAAPAKPVARMAPAPVSAAATLTAYCEHLRGCRRSNVAGRCDGTHRCADGARLALLYAQLQRTQPARDREHHEESRVDALLDRHRAASARKRTATEWAGHHENTVATRAARTAKRGGTAVEESNNMCRNYPAETVSEFRGPRLPLGNA